MCRLIPTRISGQRMVASTPEAMALIVWVFDQ